MGDLNLGLRIKLIDGFSNPMKTVRESMGGLTRVTRATNLAFGGLFRSMRAVASIGAVVGGAAAAGMITATRRFADAGDAALETSQKVGVSVPAFMRWSHAAKQSGVEAGSLEDALKFLNLSSSQAADGAKQDAQAFQRLGVSYKDAHGRLIPMERLLPQIADAFKNMEDGPRKTSIAMALFGRSGVDMIPMLNEGAAGLKKWGDEAQRMGLVMSQEAAENADAFNDSLGSLHASIFGLNNSIVGGLLPSLTGLIKGLTGMIAANRPAIIERTRVIFTQIAAALPGILRGLASFASLMGGLAVAIMPVINAVGGFNKVLDLMAVLMIGRVAVSIWSAVAAVWGLNGAMLANPIGLVIVGLAGLAMAIYGVFRQWKPITAFFKNTWSVIKAAFKAGIWGIGQLFLNFTPAGLIIKHWSKVAGFFSGVWQGIKTAFKSGVEAVWNILPAWFRQVLRGAAFVIRTVANVGGAPASGGGGGARPVSAAPPPRINIGAVAREREFRGRMDIYTYQDGRPPRIEHQSYTPNFGIADVGGVMTRGR